MHSLFSALGIGQLNPLTHEYRLSYSELRSLVDHIRQNNCAVILGGDVVNAANEYIYANWYYEPNPDIEKGENIRLSCQSTLDYIHQLNEYENLFYILVLE